MNREITALLQSALLKNRSVFHSLVPFDPTKDRLVALDLTALNKNLTEDIYGAPERFGSYINKHIEGAGAAYAIGGYDELRVVYSISEVFNAVVANEEPRRRHLGTDIWGKAGTPVYAPLNGIIHSQAFNNQYGDYGATIILEHMLDGIKFHTLYGHLSEADLKYNAGDSIPRGRQFCHLGDLHENGNWPPHLHFQLIIDIGDYHGDYPGVCTEKDRWKYLNNCPDPDLLLNLNQYII